MPSSIQTSPPAMHRRSLHPNRIYPAINGLDRVPAPSSRGTSVVPLPRPRRFARSIGARRRSLARVRRGTTDVCAPTRIGYVISRALRPDTLATFEVPIADDPPWAALSLSSLPKFFAPGLRVFVPAARRAGGREGFAVVRRYLHCHEAAFAAAYRVKSYAHALRERFGVMASPLLGHDARSSPR